MTLTEIYANNKAVNSCADFAETWGGAPPSYLGRRRALARQMREKFIVKSGVIELLEAMDRPAEPVGDAIAKDAAGRA